MAGYISFLCTTALPRLQIQYLFNVISVVVLKRPSWLKILGKNQEELS